MQTPFFRLLPVLTLLAALTSAGLLLASCDEEAEPAPATASADESAASTDATGSTDTADGSARPADAPSYQKLLPDYEAAVEENPEDLDALQDLAIAYLQTEDYGRAEEIYLRMLEIDDTAVVHNNLANVYRKWGKTDQAIEQYEMAIEMDAAFSFAYGNLARVYEAQGDIDQAVDVLEQGIENTEGVAQEQLQYTLDSIQESAE